MASRNGKPFDVAGGAADLGDDHVGLGLLGDLVDAVLDFVGDVRNDLHGFAEVIALAFVVRARSGKPGRW